MKINISTLSALAVFAATALVAQAQQPVVLNDIVVGFRPGPSGGGTTNLEVKAGSVSTLAGYTTETLIGNFNTSLNGVSSVWASSTTGSTLVQWGAIGSASSSNVFATAVWDNTTPGTLGVANPYNGITWSGLASGSVANAAVAISTMENGFNGIHATLTGDGKSITIGKSDTQSWTTAGGTGSSAFGAFTNNNGFSQNATRFATDGSSSLAFSAADLYSVSAGSSTFLGTFALYTGSYNGHSIGDLTFTASAIPEPSTYAAILGLASLGFVMIRRRQKASAV